MHWSLWVLLGLLGLCGCAGVGMYAMMVISMTPLGQRPPAKEDVIAPDAGEVPVPVSELELTGAIATYERRGLLVLDLASGKEAIFDVVPRGDRVDGIAGPNKNGIVLLLKGDFGRTEIVSVNLVSGEQKTIFKGAGDPWAADAAGVNLALASDANVALYMSAEDSKQFNNPQAYMTVGRVIKVDLDTGKQTALSDKGIDQPMALSADGATAYFCAWTDRDEAQRLPGGDRIEKSGGPIIAVARRAGRASSMIVHGWGAHAVSGDRVMIEDYNGRRTLHNRDGELLPAPALPEYMYGFKHVQENGVLIGKAQHIRTEDVEFTTNNGMPGPRPKDRIIAVDPEDLRVALLYPGIDPRREWSYGSWEGATSSEQAIQR